MSDDEIDIDPGSSELRIGVEIEYPRAPNFSEKYVSFGQRSNRLRDIVRDDGLPSSIGGRPVHDGTVGLEIVSPDTQPEGGMSLSDSWKWYADVLEYIEDEYGEPFAPTGIMNDSTAGLHIHLSPLSRSQAEALYEISMTAWAKVLFCSSIATSDQESDWRVFRGGQYCAFPGGIQRNDRNHYACVNERPGDRYEWRLPEPMAADHFELITKFLRLFEQDTEEAVQFAQEILDEGDDRVTAIRRAEAVGMDIEETPTIRRAPVGDSEDFYQRVEDTWGLPEIHAVGMSDQHFYVFDTRLEGNFEVGDVEFAHDDVLYADELEPVQDDQLRQDVLRAFNNQGNGVVHESEATDVVKDIVKKKKGGA